MGTQTFHQTTRKRHGAREQHGEDTQCDEGEAECAGEVDLEGYGASVMKHEELAIVHTRGFANFWGKERDDHFGAGNEGRGLRCWMLLDRDETELGLLKLTQPSGGAVAVEVVNLRELVSSISSPTCIVKLRTSMLVTCWDSMEDVWKFGAFERCLKQFGS